MYIIKDMYILQKQPFQRCLDYIKQFKIDSES